MGGRPQMTGACAVWELVGGPFGYADFAFISVILNVPPR